MMGRMICRLGILLVCCTVALAEEPTPTSAYFVSFARSDALGDWANYILDLRPRDGEIVIRSVRIGPPNTICSTPVIIKSHQRLVTRKTYEDFFAEANPCAVNPKSVRRAMRGRRSVDLMEHPVDVILVAACAGETRALGRPHLGGGRRPGNRKVAKLRDLYWDIHEEVFPADISFRPSDPDDDFELQEAGQQIMPELQAGYFDYWMEGESGGWWGGWQWAIDGYKGPVRAERVMTPRLLPTELEFVSFVAPDYPPLAPLARIQGTVRLALDFGPDGRVTEARLVEGHPLLAPAAMKAAPSWRVDPRSVLSTPAEVEIAFDLTCAD